ncbi:MAG: M3 family metallopeptidase [Hyphomonadaceae bacterium]|jgi:thimet oligopeptidase
MIGLRAILRGVVVAGHLGWIAAASAQLPGPLVASAAAKDMQAWCDSTLRIAAGTTARSTVVAALSDLVISAHPAAAVRDAAVACDKAAASADARRRPAQERVLLEQIAREWRQFERSLVETQPTVTFARKYIDGAPEWLLASKPRTPSGEIRVGVGPGDYFTFMRSVSSEPARRRMYLAYTNRGSEANLARLQSLAQRRYELAKLRGAEAFYDVQSRATDMPALDHVHRFLDAVERQLKPTLTEDLAFLQRMQPGRPLHRWDVPYQLERARERAIGLSDYDETSLIPAKSAVAWALAYFSRLTGVVLSDAGVLPWHPSVRCLRVADGTTARGLLCLDLYPRAGKYYNDATYAMPSTVSSDTTAVVLGNFSDPLSPDEVERLFGETAVALATLLCGDDCAERIAILPVRTATTRAFFNAMAFAEESVQVLRSVDAAAVPPPPVLRAVRLNRHFAASLALSRQAQIARFDLDLHAAKPPRDVMAAWRTREMQTPLGHEPGTRQPARLNTVAGPTAGTLSVGLWTDALAMRFQSLAPCVLCSEHKSDVVAMFFPRDGAPPFPVSSGQRAGDVPVELARILVAVAKDYRIDQAREAK